MVPQQRKKKKSWLFWIIIFGIIITIWAGINYNSSGSLIQPKVLVVPVKGYISLYGSSGFLGEVATSAEVVANRIEEADANPSISAIIIEINSPGGTIVASEEISRAIENSEKPVIVWAFELYRAGRFWSGTGRR